MIPLRISVRFCLKLMKKTLAVFSGLILFKTIIRYALALFLGPIRLKDY